MDMDKKIHRAAEKTLDFLYSLNEDEYYSVVEKFILKMDLLMRNGNFTVRLIDLLIKDMHDSEGYSYSNIGYIPFDEKDRIDKSMVMNYLKENLK